MHTQQQQQQQQQPLTQEQLTSALTQRLRGHLHPVLCVSPHGPVLATILQHYPSLERHCSISWHGQWSDSSLVAAAQAVIGDCELAPLASTTTTTANGSGGVPGGVPGGNGGSVTDALLGHMVAVYKTAQQQQQLQQQRQKLSPASFLAYAHCYKAVWCEQLAAEEKRGSAVAAALDKLKQAAHDVELLKVIENATVLLQLDWSPSCSSKLQQLLLCTSHMTSATVVLLCYLKHCVMHY
jgi:P-loop containing dynein motor region D4